MVRSLAALALSIGATFGGVTGARADGACAGCRPWPESWPAMTSSCAAQVPCGFALTVQEEKIFVGCRADGDADAEIDFWLPSSNRCVGAGSAPGSALGDGIQAASFEWPGARASWRWISGCGIGGGEKVLAFVPEAKRWEVVLDVEHNESRAQCDDEADGAERVRAEQAATQATQDRGRVHADGLRAFRRKDYAGAERLWRRIADDSIEALNDLGFLYLEIGRPLEAERTLLRVVARAPARGGAWLNLGDLEWSHGAISRAPPIAATPISPSPTGGPSASSSA